MKKKLTLLIAICYHTFLFGQHADCVNAISVCQNIYTVTAPQGSGSQPNELPPNSCLTSENNSTWFVLTPQTNGALSFVITPNSPSEDYNWAVYDITNATCADIPTNSNVQLVCNNSSDLNGSFNDAFGKTGAFTNQPWFGGIFNFYPSFTGDITVQTGEIYMVMVTNTSGIGQGQGFSIDFSASSTVLFNALQPNLDSITIPSCGSQTMDLHFNKPILCNSITPLDFTVQTSIGTMSPISVSSPNCSPATTGAASLTFTLTFPVPLTPDNYTFNIVNTISDVCGNTLSSGSTPFDVPSLPVNTGSNISICSGQSINQNIGMTGFFPNQNFQWTAEPASYLSNLSTTTAAAANLSIAQMPIDTVMFILTTSTGTGCIAKDTLYVYGNDCCSNFDAAINTYTNVGCYGTSTGTATVSVNGSLAPNYTYNWNTSPQQFSSVGTSLSANQQYIVTVTDGNQCQDTATIILSEPASPVVVASIGSNVSCFGGSDGLVDLTVTGGTSPYSYNWNNNATSQDLNNISAGTYSVTIADANNCTITEQKTINQPATALSATAVGSTISCTQTTGTINLTISGGGSPYTVDWSHNLGNTLNPTGLIPGIYRATITDNNGCQLVKSGIVSSTANISTTVATTNAACNLVADGSINLSVSGGVSPFTYNWDNNAGTVQDPNNLLPGNYNVTITDANGCLSVTNATVGSNGSMEGTALSTDVSCFNANNGSISLNISGGQTPYTINWNNGLGNTQNPTNLSANTYMATITDGLGCTDTAVAVITQPNDLLLNTNTTNISCNGGNNGNIQILVGGGLAPYTASWQGLNGSSLIQTGLSAGNYSVTITDANGCQKNTTVTLSQTSALNINLTPTHANCFNGNDGAIQSVISGGQAPFTYFWSNNATTANISNLTTGIYTVTVTDANNCTEIQSVMVNQPTQLGGTIVGMDVNCFGGSDGSIVTTPIGGVGPYTYLWSNSATTQNLTNIPAGNYLVQITDAHGCQIVLPISITQPSSFTASTSVTHPMCNNSNDGSITTTVSGGMSPYTYAWSGGLTGQNPQNVIGGTYNLTVTDANGCPATSTAILNNPTPITAIFNNTSSSCFNTNDGMIGMTISGGTSPYTYVWSGGLVGQNPQNVMPGTYNVTITDVNNCMAITTTTVNVPPAIMIAIVDNPPACGQNGTITANVTGGNAPFTYNWSANANTGNTNIAANLLGGNYTVTVTDASGCSAISNVVSFASSSNLMINTTVLQPQCQPNTGLIGITPVSGVAPFTYNWSANANVGNVNTANGLLGGMYSITVTDAFGCDTTLTITLNTANTLTGNTTITDATCGQNNGAITYNVIGGTSPFTYAWSNTPNNVNTIDNLAPGDYDLVLTDGNNCSVLETITVNGSDSLMVMDSIVQLGCDEDGGVYLTLSGGNAPYTYVWSTNANTSNTPNAMDLMAGTYDVTITDNDNCMTTASYEVNQITPFSIDIVNQTDNSCPEGLDGSISVNAINTTNTVTYTWSNGQNGQTATSLSAGNYTVTVTDIVTNCQMTESFMITSPVMETIDIGEDFVVAIGTSVVLQVNNPIVGFQYNWVGTNGFSGTGTSIETIIDDETMITVMGINGNCPSISSTIVIKVTSSGEIEIPNAFSPNNDGKNDIFRIATLLPIEIIEFKVFNRYGQVIYNDVAGAWDGTHGGKNAPNGGYIYLIQYKAPGGDEVIEKGEIILIR